MWYLIGGIVIVWIIAHLQARRRDHKRRSARSEDWIDHFIGPGVDPNL